MALQSEIEDARARVLGMLVAGNGEPAPGVAAITAIQPGPRSNEVTIWLGEREQITVSVSVWKPQV